MTADRERFERLLGTATVLTAIVAGVSACERSQSVSEELAKQAASARAAHVASAAAALSGATPLGAPAALLEEPFRAKKPTSFGSPAPMSPCTLDQVAGEVAGPITTVERN